ncbi:hypothetical protein B0H19DRAFT_1233922, partial [Mycena capillaripes]
MPPSARKDRFYVIIIHKVPQHLSKKEFEDKVEAIVDAAVLVPLVQKNLLKVEMIFQTGKLDDHVEAFGFPPRENAVLLALQSETADQFSAVLKDPEVLEVFKKGKEFGLHNGSFGLAADVVPKIDNPTPRDRIHLICVYKASPNVSPDHDQKFDAMLDNFVALPGLQKNVVNFEMWRNNKSLDDHIRAFGYSAAGSTFVQRADIANWDDALEFMKDVEA